MQNMKNLAYVVGSEEVDISIIPAIVALSADKIWRVKLAIIEFMPLLSEFIDKDIFESKMIPLILIWL